MGEEENNLTTPFDEAIDGIATAMGYLKKYGKITKEDIDGNFFKKDNEISIETIKSSFIKSANIPDGGDVVKKILERLEYHSFEINMYPDDEAEQIDWFDTCIKFIREQLQQAGIEVDDE